MADGQVTRGNEIVKPNVKKVRKLNDSVIGGFAGVLNNWLISFGHHPGILVEFIQHINVHVLQVLLRMLSRYLRGWKCSWSNIQVNQFLDLFMMLSFCCVMADLDMHHTLTNCLNLVGQLTRAAVELAKLWRTDKYLRKLDVSFTSELYRRQQCHSIVLSLTILISSGCDGCGR